MRKCTKKSKRTKTTQKYNKLKIFESRPLDRIKEETVDTEYFLQKIEEGKHNCIKCDKFFRDEHTLQQHLKTKAHKRRVKEWEKSYHTQKDAENAVGLNL